MLVFHSSYHNPSARSPIFKTSSFTHSPALFQTRLPCGRRQRRNTRIRAAAASSSSAGKDHYATLKLSRNATLQEIKSSYRNLARKYHPDMNKSPGAEEKFKEISAAYEVLSDDEKRSVYDRFGEAGLQGEYEDYGVGSQEMDPFDVFDAFFRETNELFGGIGNSSRFSYKRHQGLDIRSPEDRSFRA